MKLARVIEEDDVAEMTKFVDELGLDVNDQEYNKFYNLLGLAAKKGSYQVAKYMLSQDANVDANNDGSNQSPLDIAVQQGDLKMVQLLASRTASNLPVTATGQNVLHSAVKNENHGLDIVRYCIEVLELGVESPDPSGKTALMAASSHGRLDIVEYLVLEKEANLNAQDEKGETALSFASTLEVAKFLVSQGADVTIKDATGRTAKKIHKALKHKDIAQFLKSVERKLAPKIVALPSEQLEDAASSLLLEPTSNQQQQLQEMINMWNLEHPESITTTFSMADIEELEELGQGGFGKVVKIRHKGTIYALKKLILDPEREHSAMKSYFKEMQAISALGSNYIVKMFGQVLEPPAIVLEYMNFGSLSALIKRKHPLVQNWNQKKKLLLDVVQGIADMHKSNIIHRDMKPGNVLVGGEEDGSELFAKIADFGTAKVQGPGDAVTSTSGTPYTLMYAAPETFKRGQHATPMLDIYSFGILACELATGHQPYGNKFWENMVHFIEDVKEGERPDIDSVVPPDWKQMMERCWDGNPEARPTASELVHLVEQLSV